MNKRIKLSHFIGRQMSRLKAGQTYYMIVTSTITALGIVNLAFPGIETWLVIMLFPIALFGAFIIGYILDKSNVVTMDNMKTIEMNSRYVNKGDKKSYEFWHSIMCTFFVWMESMQKNEPLDKEKLKIEYEKFLKKWSPIKEEEDEK